MIEENPSSDHVMGFRRTAEEMARGNPIANLNISGALEPDEMLRMLHQMQELQIELEIQNEELRLAQSTREQAEGDYADLYELAPVGYVTVDGQGVIRKANLTAVMMFGVVRDALINQLLGRYVAPESQDAYHHHCQTHRDGGGHSCELRMLKGDGSVFWVRMDCRAGLDPQGADIFRAALVDISEEYRSREALNASVDFSNSLINSMKDGFSVLDVDGVATDANLALCEMTGFSKEELIGRSAPHPYWPPEEYATIQAALENTMSHEGMDFELIFMRKNGERFPVIVSAFPVKDRDGKTMGFAATVKEITDRKNNEAILRDWNMTLERRVAERTAELYESEARFRMLVEVSGEGIVINKDGIILDGNRQLGEIFGCDVSSMLGRRSIEFVAHESRALVAGRMTSGDESTYEFVGLRDDGTKVPMEARGRMMTWQGVERRVTNIRDLSTEKAVEARLAAQKAELDQALRLAIISEVCAGIIHQIGQPLCAAGANIAAAAVRFNSCDTKTCGSMELIRAVDGDVKRMRELVNHLRALAHPDKPERKPIDFNEMVTNALGRIRSDAWRQGMEFNVNFAAELPLLLGDSVQLSQVVINLVCNAIDASADFPLERRVVEISTREISGGEIELSIRDRGIGMKPEALDQLFTPFFSTKTEGLGVGLRLCRTIVEAHGGSINGVNNSDGPGMTFSVLLLSEVSRHHTKV